MEKSMVEKLYDGGIYPSEQIIIRHPEYKKLSNEYDRYKEKAETALSKQEIERMDDLFGEIRDWDMKEAFSHGLKIGLFLMMDLIGIETTD